MKFKLYAKKFIRILLMLIFRFDWWHTSPLENRKYAIDIIAELNQKLERESIIELGCGLGDIVGNAKYKKRYFYDISENVLNAAKFLQFYSRSKTENSYRVFDLFRDVLSSNLKFDAIVIVNWIHGYDQIVLRKNLDKIIYNNLKERGLVIFDVINDNSAYKYNHKINDLIDKDQFKVKILGEYPNGRSIVIAQFYYKEINRNLMEIEKCSLNEK